MMSILQSKKSRQFWQVYVLMIVSVVLFSVPAHAIDLPDEKEEEAIERVTEALTPAEEEEVEKERALKGRLSSNIKLSYGYETNPKLATLRKGDHFQTARYTLNYRKTALKNNQFSLVIDATTTKYNEITDLSNELGHIRFDYKNALTKEYIFGIGYDYSYTYYALNDQTTFNYPKVFASIQHRVNKNFYHQLQYEFGFKFYESALALQETSTTFQDNKRKDVREGLEYSMGYTLSDRLSSTISLRGYFNNSNAAFRDFHDYHSYKISPRISYKINDQLLTNVTYSFEYKAFTSRHVNSGTYEQLDRINNAKIGLKYRHNDKHSFTLDYTYRENASNDQLSDYTNSTIEGGWRYIF